MNELEAHCKKHMVCLDKLILKGEEYLKHAPEGSLRISNQENIYRYYWKCGQTKTQGTYIQCKNKKLAYQLAQKDYTEKFVKVAKKQSRILHTFVNQYNWNEMAKLHEKMSTERQALIAPMILSEGEYANQWEQRCLKSKLEIGNDRFYSYYPVDENNGFLTEKGEMVRSKSEKIIADKLFKLGIPYIYEMPVVIDRNVVLHPDFTVLNKRTRREYYWEHFGLMDKEEYSEQVVRKINTYEDCDIYQGKNLLVTYESSAYPLNIRRLGRMLEEFLL